MGIFNKPKEETKQPAVKETKPEVVKVEKKKTEKPTEVKTKAGDIKGAAKQNNHVLIKPLITEKATHLGAINKYVFAINPKMNKVEVKKAIRAVYKVDPIKINISNFSGKLVRYGKTSGRTKAWKKAIITLKAGDKIEVYEGV